MRTNEAGNHLPQITPEVEKRFWANVEIKGPRDCWEWKAGRAHFGHGKFTIKRRTFVSSRISWTINNGGVYPIGVFVLHKCDNPPCQNPSHLFLGTQKDNIQDAVAKGRMASGARNGAFTHPESRARGSRSGASTHPEKWRRGDEHHKSKLSNEKVKQMRILHAQGVPSHDLACRFGVSKSAVNNAVSRRFWKHVL